MSWPNIDSSRAKQQHLQALGREDVNPFIILQGGEDVLEPHRLTDSRTCPQYTNIPMLGHVSRVTPLNKAIC